MRVLSNCFAALEIFRPVQEADDDFELLELPRAQVAYPRDESKEKEERERGLKRQEKLEWLLHKADMKFSHSLQFNAVPDWSSHYIAYSNLKKL